MQRLTHKSMLIMNIQGEISQFVLTVDERYWACQRHHQCRNESSHWGSLQSSTKPVRSHSSQISWKRVTMAWCKQVIKSYKIILQSCLSISFSAWLKDGDSRTSHLTSIVGLIYNRSPILHFLISLVSAVARETRSYVRIGAKSILPIEIVFCSGNPSWILKRLYKFTGCSCRPNVCSALWGSLFLVWIPCKCNLISCSTTNNTGYWLLQVE